VVTLSAQNRLWRAFSRFVAIPRVSLLLMRLATRVDRPLMRKSGGRLRLSFVMPLVLLRCPGARTGIVREVPLLYVPDGTNVVLIGSNGGQRAVDLYPGYLQYAKRAGRTIPVFLLRVEPSGPACSC
jgi:hypothetical protein